VTQPQDPAAPRPAPEDGKAQASSGSESPPLRYEGSYVRLSAGPRRTLAPAKPPADRVATAPAPSAAPAPPPTGSEPPSGATAPDAEAEATAAMARMQARLDHIAEVQRQAAADLASSSGVVGSAWLRRNAEPLLTAVAVLVACAAVLAAYLWFAVPGSWRAGSEARAYGVNAMQLTRGSGARIDGELVIEAPGEGGIAIVSLTTDLPAAGYRGIAWQVADLPPGAKVSVLWFSDLDPRRIQSLPAQVEAGRVRPVVVANAPGWRGGIRGLGLSVAGEWSRPVRISAVTVKPMGAADVLSDRLAEWRAFEGWTGTSINVVVGGADVQDFPLPTAVAAVVGFVALLLLGVHRLRPALLPHAGTVVAVVALAGWLVLDLRWTTNLARQVAVTADAFAGKAERDRHLADVDGVLYEFVERARAVLPGTPQRIWVASDAPFFNGRAAYHLYPNDVHFAPRDRAMPDRRWVKPGDWLLVFNRRGVEYNARNETLRWDGGAEVPAVLRLPGNSAALFQFK